jgi:phosphoribosyl 1,2-cyclic phosphate phosphodiesterase
MKIQFLGTSASPSTPLPFCQCPFCTIARKAGGKNLRRRSSIIMNDDLLIDLGPDIMSSSYEYRIDLSVISVCLQTHPHEDHFDPELIISRHSEYGARNAKDLLIAGSRQTLETMDAMISRRCDYGSIFDPKVQLALGIKLLAVTPFVPYQINDYLVTGVPANHGSAQQGCLLFKIEAKDKCLFYGTDTSIINDEVWDHLKATKTKIDLVILDLTYGIGYASKPGDHLGAKDFIDHVQRFKACGLLKKKGEIYATHLSHEGALEHGEFECYARKYDFHIAFDGLTLKI